MSLPNKPNGFEATLDQTAQLFSEGARVLHAMLNGGDGQESLRFEPWANSLRVLPELDSELTTNNRLIWLWESLRTAPDLSDYFGELPGATVPWTSKNQRFDVFDPGEWFVIGMNAGEVAALMQRADTSPELEQVCVHTKESLRMRPGKGNRLECCDCHVDVMIRVDDVSSITREADIMRVKEDRIELVDGLVKVQTGSLNQAYTVSSRRLEPERRAHGGRTYSHVVHVRNSKRTRLEDIRRAVESSCWESSGSLVKPHPSSRTLFD